MFSDFAACSDSKEGTFAGAEGKIEHVCMVTKWSQPSEVFLGALVTRCHNDLWDISGSSPTHCFSQFEAGGSLEFLPLLIHLLSIVCCYRGYRKQWLVFQGCIHACSKSLFIHLPLRGVNQPWSFTHEDQKTKLRSFSVTLKTPLTHGIITSWSISTLL